MSDNIFVNFLPWLTIYQNLTLGKITFWNFYRESKEKINDIKLRKRLEKHFKSYKNTNGSLTTITICSFEGKSFYDALNENEFNQLKETITALAFASSVEKIEGRIQKTHKHIVPPSMNAFDLMSRQLNFNSNNYAHVSLSLLDLGMKEGHITFQKPLGARDDVSISTKWLKYLSAYLALKDSSEIKNRISRSLEFFRLAQAQDDLKDNSPDSAFLTRVVLLATAFESLLYFPSRSAKKAYFASYINDRFSLKNSRKGTRKELRKKYPKVRFSLISCWAYDFYNLRNSIVHGNKINDENLRFKKGFWFSQMDVAVLVFADCLEEIIREKKLIKGKKIRIGKRSLEDLFLDDIFESRGVENWKKHHKVLGWIR